MKDLELGIITEGGNARYINRETGETMGFADKMDLKQIPRKVLVDEMVKVLEEINTLFKKKTGEKLWNNFSVITSGKALNGSSASLFNKDITDEEFTKHKPKVGDIDITFPGEFMGQLWELLNDIEGKQLTPMIKYLGHKNSNMNPEAAKNQAQINAIFEIKTPNYTINSQIDFEASEYENDAPTEWASFSHNSDWADIKSGFKGVAHKFALLNLARAQSKLDGIQVLTLKNAEKVAELTKSEYESGKPIKVSTSKEYANPTNLAFSVAKGIRTKFAPVLFKDGEQMMIDGKPVFYEKSSKTDKYVTNLETQFEMIFQKQPTGNDMKLFSSFVGLVELMKKYSTKKIISDFFFNQLVSKTLFCANGCQGLERNNPEGDLEIKGAMVNYLYDNFTYLKKYKSDVDAAIEEYYKNYKMIDISESFIPYGSKLSTIFEAVDKTKKMLEPKGWSHLDKVSFEKQKRDVLKKLKLNDKEIGEFLNCQNGSKTERACIDKIKKENRDVFFTLDFEKYLMHRKDN